MHLLAIAALFQPLADPEKNARHSYSWQGPLHQVNVLAE
jgi:hypothetical protein